MDWEVFLSHIEVLSMAMNTSYSQVVKDAYSDIATVYDVFHIIK